MDTQKIAVAAIAIVIVVGAVLLLRWFERPDPDDKKPAGKQ